MKKTFEFSKDEEKYILKNTNPNENKEPFVIYKNTMQFETQKFYEYVFEDIEDVTEICVVNSVDVSDKEAERTCKTISEISNGVMEMMNKKCFD